MNCKWTLLYSLCSPISYRPLFTIIVSPLFTFILSPSIHHYPIALYSPLSYRPLFTIILSPSIHHYPITFYSPLSYRLLFTIILSPSIHHYPITFYSPLSYRPLFTIILSPSIHHYPITFYSPLSYRPLFTIILSPSIHHYHIALYWPKCHHLCSPDLSLRIIIFIATPRCIFCLLTNKYFSTLFRHTGTCETYPVSPGKGISHATTCMSAPLDALKHSPGIRRYVLSCLYGFVNQRT